MTDPTKAEPQSSNPPPTKKPYRAPALIHWGTLQDITQSAGKNASAAVDNPPSFKGNRKTN